jgi:TPR repeat protein
VRIPRWVWVASAPFLVLAIFVAAMPASVKESLARNLENSGHHAIANRIFSWECSQLQAEACRWLRLEHNILSQSGIPDLQRAVDVFSKSCDRGEEAECLTLGRMYENGLGVSQNYAQAAVLYSELCNQGKVDGCSNLGVLYAEGDGVEEDFEFGK